MVKPFIKWLGGKTQLLPNLETKLPPHIKQSKQIPLYIEPFIGGGAFFFSLQTHYKIEKSIISDLNTDLINCYKDVKDNSQELIDNLSILQNAYLQSNDKKKYYLEKRNEFNNSNQSVNKSSLLIFLNKTCFNGLFRVNSKNKFNVPFGKHENPNIFDQENIKSISKILQNTIILNVDFELTKQYIEKDCFVYMDPPYRPISKTSNFKQYTANGFSNTDQVRLKDYCNYIKEKEGLVLISNSDPSMLNINDNYFEKLYDGFVIDKVKANRSINCIGSKRAKINELLITNY